MEKTTMIETTRLRIRMASQNEMRSILEGETDPELKTAYGEMLQGCLDHPEQWQWYAIWLIETKDGLRVGDLCFKGFPPDGGVEIGYGILEPFQRKGYASEAVEGAVRWALAQPGVTRVEAETDPDNLASQRVLARCGFLPTGEMGEEGPRFVKRKAEAPT